MRKKVVTGMATGGQVGITLLWAKTSRERPGDYHPLICHMIDVAAVAEALWDGSLTTAMRQWLADAHDLGKASPGFQAKAFTGPCNGCALTLGLLCNPVSPSAKGRFAGEGVLWIGYTVRGH